MSHLGIEMKNKRPTIIVSLTSYPARINSLSQVLNSLYAQSVKADRIILWLGKEQFSNLENDLPQDLINDYKKSLFELKWCEDLGSHKKYYYAMQEHPNDIIITVDDDKIYAPNMIETLYNSYKKHPQAISANCVSLLTFGKNEELLPPNRWIYNFHLIKDVPSLQLMAIGSAGILYPPGTHDSRIFDRSIMEKLCRNLGVLFLNDAWLKVNELLCEIPVVYTGGNIATHTVSKSWETAIKNNLNNDNSMSEKEVILWQEATKIYDGPTGLLTKLNNLKSSSIFWKSEEDAVLKNAVCNFKEATDNYLYYKKHNMSWLIINTILELNRQMSLGMSKEKLLSYIPEYQEKLEKYILPNELPLRFLPIDALKTYGIILSHIVNRGGFRSDYNCYQQMLLQWQKFLDDNKNIPDVYHEGYLNFLEEGKKFVKITDAAMLEESTNNNQQIKISVIIPVYNSEKYISKCIDSLKNQSLKQIEFIFVDDCSTDKGMKYVNDWAISDSRVKIIRNEQNLGEGASRNRGIRAAKGKYINTIDPDDWLAYNYYELLYAKAIETNADLVKVTRIKIDEETEEEIFPRSYLNTKIEKDLEKNTPLYLDLFYEHQTVVFKRELLNDKIEYGKSANACDTTFMLKLVSSTKSIAIENDAFYYYLQRKGSATNSYSLNRSKNELISLQELVEFFLQDNSFDENAYKYLASRYSSYISRFSHADKSEEIANKDKEDYISSLKEIMMRIPNYSELYKYCPELELLIDEGIILTSVMPNEKSIFIEEFVDWADYVVKTNGNKKVVMSARLRKLLERHHNKQNDGLQSTNLSNYFNLKDRIIIYLKLLKRKINSREIYEFIKVLNY